jgi:hypothetical protein
MNDGIDLSTRQSYGCGGRHMAFALLDLEQLDEDTLLKIQSG